MVRKRIFLAELGMRGEAFHLNVVRLPEGLGAIRRSGEARSAAARRPRAPRQERVCSSVARPRPASSIQSPNCGARSTPPAHRGGSWSTTISSLASIDFRMDDPGPSNPPSSPLAEGADAAGPAWRLPRSARRRSAAASTATLHRLLGMEATAEQSLLEQQAQIISSTACARVALRMLDEGRGLDNVLTAITVWPRRLPQRGNYGANLRGGKTSPVEHDSSGPGAGRRWTWCVRPRSNRFNVWLGGGLDPRAGSSGWAVCAI